MNCFQCEFLYQAVEMKFSCQKAMLGGIETDFKMVIPS